MRDALSPRAADEALEPVRVVRDSPGVNHDEAAAPRQERLEVGAFLPVGDVAGLLRVQDQHVGVVELRLRGEGVAPVARAPRIFRSGTHSLRKRG